jgi:hypothetical protein
MPMSNTSDLYKHHSRLAKNGTVKMDRLPGAEQMLDRDEEAFRRL